MHGYTGVYDGLKQAWLSKSGHNASRYWLKRNSLFLASVAIFETSLALPLSVTGLPILHPVRVYRCSASMHQQ